MGFVTFMIELLQQLGAIRYFSFARCVTFRVHNRAAILAISLHALQVRCAVADGCGPHYAVPTSRGLYDHDDYLNRGAGKAGAPSTCLQPGIHRISRGPYFMCTWGNACVHASMQE